MQIYICYRQRTNPARFRQEMIIRGTSIVIELLRNRVERLRMKNYSKVAFKLLSNAFQGPLFVDQRITSEPRTKKSVCETRPGYSRQKKAPSARAALKADYCPLLGRLNNSGASREVEQHVSLEGTIAGARHRHAVHLYQRARRRQGGIESV